MDLRDHLSGLNYSSVINQLESWLVSLLKALIDVEMLERWLGALEWRVRIVSL